ncbi:MAG: metallophosphoesterase, partial [Candidatus Hydrogenedentes bacterium]|nr:metallophosphoesterase [Candidatus Hydrogenedentota bacterium]
DFVVTGDSQSNKQLVFQTDLFKQMIREWNLVKPAFVVEVGDIVLGGSAQGLPPQWDLFQDTIAQCKPPYFAAPGNHDISDILSEKLWQERMGPTRYAFSYGNSRFIALDSEEVDAPDRLSDGQVAWLKQELETTTARNIFLFLHQPYFTDHDDPRIVDQTWEQRWKYLADIMHGHPVRAVFAGHIHCYRDFGVRDGVHYAICGGAASFGKGSDDLGNFNHYLLVRVRGEEVDWLVIKPGAVLPSDVCTNAHLAELYDIHHHLVFCDDLPAPYGQPFDRNVTIHIQNPFDKPFDSSIAWQVPEGWKVEPLSKNYSVAANGSVDVTFHVAADCPAAVRFPVPSFKTRYANTSFGTPVDVNNVEMPLVPVAEATRATREIVVDGVLDEWNGATPIVLPYPEGFGRGEYTPADLSGQCRAMWDDTHLYVAFEIIDNEHYQPYAGDIVWLADAIEFGIDRWAWGISLTKAGPEVFMYLGEGMSAETVNKDVKLAVRRETGRTIYEVAFPAALVKPLALEAGSSFRFRAQVADVDREGGPKHELSLSPGGDSAPGIKIVLKK